MKSLNAVRDCTTANFNFEGKLINDFLFTVAGVNKTNGIRKILVFLRWTVVRATNVHEIIGVGKR